MQTSKVEPTIAYMPGFRISGPYDPWRMVADIFSHYQLNGLREEFWGMYKSAMMDKGIHKKSERRSMTDFYEVLNDLTTASYFLAMQKGLNINVAKPLSPFFPVWKAFEYDPWNTLFTIFDDYQLDEIRGQLWRMYKAAIQDKANYHARPERYKLIFLFERMNDLVTAAYVLAKDNYHSQTSKNKADAPTVTTTGAC